MRNHSALVTLLLLALGCPAMGATTAILPAANESCPAVPEPSSAMAMPDARPVSAPGLDESRGFEGAPIGSPRPEIPYDAAESYNDGLTNAYCTSHFRTFEGRPIAHADVFEGCCGGAVERVHMDIDTDGGKANDALLARLTARYGEPTPYVAWPDRPGFRFSGAAFELRAILFADAKGHVRLVFAAVGAGDGFDRL